MNRSSLALLLLVLASGSLLQCGGDQKPAQAPAPTATIAPAELPPAPTTGPDAGTAPDSAAASNDAVKPTTAAPDGIKPNALTDEQIAAVTDEANSAEVEQGKIARLKSKDRDVQRFSAKMIAAHEEAKQNQDKLKLPTAESKLGNSIGMEAASTMNTLKSSEGAAFDKAYIDAQVDEHQKLLDALNDKLLPNVKNPDLKAYLNQILPHVARHLKEAQDIQRELATKTAAASATNASGKERVQIAVLILHRRKTLGPASRWRPRRLLMIGFNSSLRGVRFAAMVCVSIAAACSSDDNHGPTIGAPTTTVPIVEGGGTPSIGGTSNPSTGGDTSFAGTFAAGGIGTGAALPAASALPAALAWRAPSASVRTHLAPQARSTSHSEELLARLVFESGAILQARAICYGAGVLRKAHCAAIATRIHGAPAQTSHHGTFIA